jgi:hypothetical protein
MGKVNYSNTSNYFPYSLMSRGFLTITSASGWTRCLANLISSLDDSECEVAQHLKNCLAFFGSMMTSTQFQAGKYGARLSLGSSALSRTRSQACELLVNVPLTLSTFSFTWRMGQYACRRIFGYEHLDTSRTMGSLAYMLGEQG